MTAKEMFEELGYKKYLNKYDKQAKKEWGFQVYFRYKYRHTEVLFDCLDEDISVYNTVFGKPTGISVALLQAINKQVEELGWK